MSNVLYQVDNRDRLNLEGVVDAKFYTVDKADDGVITLTPVEVVTTTVKRTANQTEADAAPFAP